jgi:hypothetical protein
VTRNKTENSLPKTLPGAVFVQMIRCGKPTCRCARGELHGPYYYRFVWRKGKQHKQYVRRADVAQIQQACETHRTEAQRWRTQRKLDRQHIRSLLADLKAMIVQMREEEIR